MSRHDAVDRLANAIELEAVAIDALREALVAQRLEFAALRPSTIDQSLASLQPAVDAVRRRADQREHEAAELARELGLAGDVTVTRLRAALSRADHSDHADHASAALAAAAQLARRAAGRMRVEARVSERLLGAARDARETVLRSLGANVDAANVYDRSARTVPSSGQGGLLRGTV